MDHVLRSRFPTTTSWEVSSLEGIADSAKGILMTSLDDEKVISEPMK
jgi:hypothetical protein